jgi:hypothetical protein
MRRRSEKGREESSSFLKKRTKNFFYFASRGRHDRRVRPAAKVFWFFFQKRTASFLLACIALKVKPRALDADRRGTGKTCRSKQQTLLRVSLPVVSVLKCFLRRRVGRSPEFFIPLYAMTSSGQHVRHREERPAMTRRVNDLNRTGKEIMKPQMNADMARLSGAKQ